VTDRKDSLVDWERLGWALREVYPHADCRTDKKIAKAWSDCLAELHLVLERHVPGYDFDRFDMAIGNTPSGFSKRDRRILGLIAVLVSMFLFWQYHSYAMKNARIAGHGDVWAGLCENHPKLAEQLLNEPEDEFPRIYHCKDFEHHFEENP